MRIFKIVIYWLGALVGAAILREILLASYTPPNSGPLSRPEDIDTAHAASWAIVQSACMAVYLGVAVFGHYRFFRRPKDNSANKPEDEKQDEYAASTQPVDWKQEEYAARIESVDQEQGELVQITPTIDEGTFFEQAYKELEADKMVIATWSRAFAEAEGDDAKAKALYIKARVSSQKQELLAKHEADRREAEQKQRVKEADEQRAKEAADREAKEVAAQRVQAAAEQRDKDAAEQRDKEAAEAINRKKARKGLVVVMAITLVGILGYAAIKPNSPISSNGLKSPANSPISSNGLKSPARGQAGKWFPTDQPNCLIWNPQPEIEETATYSGGCLDGKAHGWGTVTWRIKLPGKWIKREIYGERRNGTLTGKVNITYENGDNFLGTLDIDGNPLDGIYSKADGSSSLIP